MLIRALAKPQLAEGFDSAHPQGFKIFVLQQHKGHSLSYLAERLAEELFEAQLKKFIESPEATTGDKSRRPSMPLAGALPGLDVPGKAKANRVAPLR